MNLIKQLDTGKTIFFDHLNPYVVELLSKVVANPIEVGIVVLTTMNGVTKYKRRGR